MRGVDAAVAYEQFVAGLGGSMPTAQEHLEAKLLALVRDLVAHGYGKLEVSSTVVAGTRRKVVLTYGRMHVFLVDEELTRPFASV